MSLDVELVLHKLEDLKLLRLNKPSGEWYQIYCPFHSNGEEKRPSCGVALTDQFRSGRTLKAGTFHCFTCNTVKSLPDTITYLLQQHAVSKTGLEWLKENIEGFEDDYDDFDYLIPQNLMNAINANYAIDYINSLVNQNNTNFISEQELATYRQIVPYMYERGLTNELIEKYDIGYDANFTPPGKKKPVPSITFPVKDRNGNTLFLCRRSIKGKMFNYPQGVEKSLYGIYELPKNTKSVVICESCINALTAIKYGYHAVALLGTGTSYEINQLKELGVQEYVICLDPDDAGRRGAAKLKKALSSTGLVWVVDMPDGKDLNDCTKEEFDAVYANRH